MEWAICGYLHISSLTYHDPSSDWGGSRLGDKINDVEKLGLRRHGVGFRSRLEFQTYKIE
jgi:hypothetical protein